MYGVFRKLTSITLMTIMVAGGLTIAVPGVTPDALAAPKELANLGVSSTVFGGAMVLEIIIKDNNIGATDTAQGEPDVSFDGNDLRMIQGSDGYWYAYVAHAGNVEKLEADMTRLDGKGLDFGEECSDKDVLFTNKLFGNSATVYTASNVTCAMVDDIDDTTAFDVYNNVVRSAKTPTPNPTTTKGGIGNNELVHASYWPFIQAFDQLADDSSIKVIYNKGGSPQEIIVNYEETMDDFTSFDLDRGEKYPFDTQVHMTINDNQLNVDPTDDDIWTFDAAADSKKVYYYLFDDSGTETVDVAMAPMVEYSNILSTIHYGDNVYLTVNTAPNSADVLKIETNTDGAHNFITTPVTNLVTITETSINSGVFVNTDSAHKSNLATPEVTNEMGKNLRDKDFNIVFGGDTINRIVGYFSAALAMDRAAVGSDWSSGEVLPVSLTDQDLNKNSLIAEDLILPNSPAVQIGSEDSFIPPAPSIPITSIPHTTIFPTQTTGSEPGTIVITGGTASSAAFDINPTPTDTAFLNSEGLTLEFDISALGSTAELKIWTTNGGDFLPRSSNTGFFVGNQGTINLSDHPDKRDVTFAGDLRLGMKGIDALASGTIKIIFHINDDNVLLLEETGVNTGVFVGTIEYIMLNQINKGDGKGDAKVIAAVAAAETDEAILVLSDSMTVEDAIRIEYDDINEQVKNTRLSESMDASTHSGSVTLDQETYKVADTVIITLTDADLNTDADVIDIYTVVDDDGIAGDTIANFGTGTGDESRLDSIMLEATFDDNRWTRCDVSDDGGFGNNIASLRETGKNTGVFKADFQIPEDGIGDDQSYCSHVTIDNSNYVDKAQHTDSGLDTYVTTVTGLDLAVIYYDYLDDSGNPTEVGDSAGISASTGSVSFDKSVYPVPFGNVLDNSHFPLHATAFADRTVDVDDETLVGVDSNIGNVIVHIQVNDRDYDISASGVDTMPASTLEVKITRGSAEHEIDITDTLIRETAKDTGIFELDLPIAHNVGPWENCPTSFDANDNGERNMNERCILQGDIITVQYEDPADASGNENTVTDSATFDLRNGVLQADKSVYIIGSDMILTLIEPDLDLDNDEKQSYTLDIIEWDSDAATVTMGEKGGDVTNNGAAFDPEPSNLQETGDSTGIFQSVIEIPGELGGEKLDRGEEIVLEYTDWGPSGADYVGDQDEDINLTVFTSNFGATIELDQKVYTWTDKVFISIVAPDHNFDSNLVDEIGDTSDDPIIISTQGDKLENYRLAETGPDTGIFTGEVILTGFQHNADGDSKTGTDGFDIGDTSPIGSGPTGGMLPATDDDGISVSFEFSEDETVVGSSLIRWNIGEVEWLEASYPASGTGIIRVIDPDMNWNPESVDNFEIIVISDSIVSGISLTVTETNEATGIFEGTVFFSTTDAPTGSRLRVAEGDTITAKYDDNTLPDPYTTADELTVTATALIGTIVPPLERAPVKNLKAVDPFGNTLDVVSVDQQIQIAADLTNGQDKDQPFAYLVQIQDSDGVTVSLAWIDGTLAGGQSFSPAQSWIPSAPGIYKATAFVWESVNNPTALSPPVETTITVN